VTDIIVDTGLEVTVQTIFASFGLYYLLPLYTSSFQIHTEVSLFSLLRHVVINVNMNSQE
jgi:hypothetical protein